MRKKTCSYFSLFVTRTFQFLAFDDKFIIHYAIGVFLYEFASISHSLFRVLFEQLTFHFMFFPRHMSLLLLLWGGGSSLWPILTLFAFCTHGWHTTQQFSPTSKFLRRVLCIPENILQIFTISEIMPKLSWLAKIYGHHSVCSHLLISCSLHVFQRHFLQGHLPFISFYSYPHSSSLRFVLQEVAQRSLFLWRTISEVANFSRVRIQINKIVLRFAIQGKNLSRLSNSALR